LAGGLEHHELEPRAQALGQRCGQVDGHAAGGAGGRVGVRQDRVAQASPPQPVQAWAERAPQIDPSMDA